MLAALALAVHAEPSRAEMDMQGLELDQKVVLIIAAGSRGSGVVVTEDGIVATNFHVVEVGTSGRHLSKVKLVFKRDGQNEEHDGLVVFVNPSSDIALIKSQSIVGRRKPVTLTSAEPPQGAAVYSLGFPGAADIWTHTGISTDPSIADGTVSRVFDGAWSDQSKNLRIVQHTATIAPGNSGGPLLNGCGDLVGLNTQGLTRSAGIFAASHASELAKHLANERYRFQSTGRWCSQPGVGVWAWFLPALVLGGGAAGLVMHRRRTKPRPAVAGRLVLSGADSAGRPVSVSITRASLISGVVLGRDPHCGVVLGDDSVSRRHLLLRLGVGGAILVEDMKSSNGTKIDGSRIPPSQPMALRAGGILTVGKLQLATNWTDARG
ncbi:MAG: trypsin-like peptidase domain-containing protein [Alphaproteobacteria bacterium]|nr:trypsin-like peptidase domain-containing protein [Alphaproteobacteria bacterium]MBF0391250.1 trypsin-like peptidase domain-containing protein [Alphaproteobacteria bacterium]